MRSVSESMHQSKSTQLMNALSLGSNLRHTFAASTKLSTPRMLRMRDRSRLNRWNPFACRAQIDEANLPSQCVFATRQRAPEELTTTAGSGGGRGTAAAAVVYGKCGGDERAEEMRIWRERGWWGGEEQVWQTGGVWGEGAAFHPL